MECSYVLQAEMKYSVKENRELKMSVQAKHIKQAKQMVQTKNECTTVSLTRLQVTFKKKNLLPLPSPTFPTHPPPQIP